MSAPYDFQDKNDLKAREVLVVYLVLFLIQILKPWQYSHQQKEFFDEIKAIIFSAGKSTKK